MKGIGGKHGHLPVWVADQAADKCGIVIVIDGKLGAGTSVLTEVEVPLMDDTPATLAKEIATCTARQHRVVSLADAIFRQAGWRTGVPQANCLRLPALLASRRAGGRHSDE